MKVLAGVLAGLLPLVLSIMLVASIGGGGACAGVGLLNVASIPPDASVAGYGMEQLRNAGHVMNAATKMELPVRAQQIAVMTAMGESSLRNIDHGDGAVNPDGSIADSIGLSSPGFGRGSVRPVPSR
ncbi:hypothetical protein [Plantibacter sp. RU18]|uniref:hypothetical protein n=1 Tax=Plantibacter sp. RU18 TaxID=3158143 RepID=UPI003D36EB10